MAPNKQASTVLIAKGASWPRDQNACSFLTIPPEIRNAIYECAFVRDEMVIVDKEEHGKPDEFDPEYVLFNPRGENEYDLSPFKAQGVHLPISLLRSCRQIYHEAAGMLYGSNAFLVSVPQHLHNLRHDQLKAAVRWLRSIGSQTQLVNAILIDTTSECINACEMPARIFSIESLVKIMWQQPWLQTCIKFTSTARRLDTRLHDQLEVNQPTDLEVDRFDAAKMNFILSEIVTADPLQLARYTSFNRLTHFIVLDRNLNTGDVSVPAFSFLSRYWQPSIYRREFAVDHQQQKIVWNTAQPTAPLNRLSSKAIDLILKYIAYEPEGTLFDLDHRQIFNNPLPYYAIDRSIRLMIQHRLQTTREVVVRTRVRDSRASGIDIASLRLWLEGPGEALFPHGFVPWILTKEPPPVIELIIEPANSEKSPRDFFVNITDLVLLTTMPDHFIIRFTNAIKKNTDDEDAGDFEIHTVLLTTLRQKYFLMLSYAIIACVSKRYDYEPEIWVNGEGKIFETSHLPPSSAASDHIPEPRVSALEDLSREETIEKGLRLADRIREIELARKVAVEEDGLEEEKAFLTWNQLRMRDWEVILPVLE